MGVFWEVSFWYFFFLTCLIGGGAAWLSGRALAIGWRPYVQVVIYMSLFGLAVRFFHYGLFDGTLLSVHYYIVDAGVLLASASLAYRVTRTTQMVTQYYWLYRRTSPISWAERHSGVSGN